MPSRLPSATYRLQFRAGVGFKEALELVPYLDELGVSHLYASPLFMARQGSTHGYDVVHPALLDPSLGSSDDFDALVTALRERGMGLVLDFVPNHMAADDSDVWWMDVLEYGRASAYADFFDINWLPCGDGGREALLLPMLAGPLRQCLRDGSLRLTLHASPVRGPALFLEHYGQRFPLPVPSWPGLLGLAHATGAGEGADADSRVGTIPAPDGRTLQRSMSRLSKLLQPAMARTGDVRGLLEPSAAARLQTAFAALYEKDADVRRFLERRLATVDSAPPTDRARLLLHALRWAPYRLADARVATTAFAYRRFFDISGLIGLRVEDERVFGASHELILRLAAEGKVDGVRLDHVDGLLDPTGYLQRLRERLDEAGASDLYLIVEKISGPGETLRPDWPVDGTTGYDFMSAIGQVLVDRHGLRILADAHARLTGQPADFAELSYSGQRMVLDRLFPGELAYLVALLDRLTRDVDPPPVFSPDELGEALAEVTCSLPVYRTYIRDLQPAPTDVEVIQQAVQAAEQRNPAGMGKAPSYIGKLLSLDPSNPVVAAHSQDVLNLVLRWQQLTAAVTAKGVEDTALYRDTRLLSLDEVGSEPSVTASALGRLHERNRGVLTDWPGSLNATSTHDAKRSEDVRARLDVLSEIPGEWSRRLEEWMAENAAKRAALPGGTAPDGREEILIYETLVGAWPPGASAGDPQILAEFVERVKQYLVKALREAKLHSDWRRPDTAYEGAATGFVDAIFAAADSPFVSGLSEFSDHIGFLGAVNSLAQILVKVVSPGVPDFYQGNELWELSLTDPDNRRPVDFVGRQRLLRESGAAAESEGETAAAGPFAAGDPTGGGSEWEPALLLSGWRDGRIKLLVTQRALALRRANKELFERGDYVDLTVRGPLKEHLVAMARRLDGAWALAAAPRLPVALLGFPPGPYGGEDLWSGTAIELPADAPALWRDVMTGARVEAEPGGKEGPPLLPVAAALARLPVAFLTNV